MNESFLDIQNLINDIERKKIVIPSFQRQYVWSFSNAKFLIESIVKDFPIGSILTWETDEKIILRKEDKSTNKSSIVLSFKRLAFLSDTLIFAKKTAEWLQTGVYFDPR